MFLGACLHMQETAELEENLEDISNIHDNAALPNYFEYKVFFSCGTS